MGEASSPGSSARQEAGQEGSQGDPVEICNFMHLNFFRDTDFVSHKVIKGCAILSLRHFLLIDI